MMESFWFFNIVERLIRVVVDGEDRGQVKNIEGAKKVGQVQVELSTSECLKLSLERFNYKESGRPEPSSPGSRSSFVKYWGKYLKVDVCHESSSTDNTDSDCSSRTLDVHVSNLCPPNPSRSTRLLDHEHVGSLVESFQGSVCGQLVLFIGMVSQGTDVSRLSEANVAEVEVLGGNHTREALQALHKKGSLDVETVKVNIYRPLPQTSALAIGYQHNFLLHEKRRPVTFLDKVRLMRECRSTDRTEAQWKDMLVVIFRLKDRGTLQRQMTHHLLMAKLPETIWSRVVRFGDVNEKFYRNLMRISDESLQENCMDVLLADGSEKFKNKVKEYIDMGHTRSKKKANKITSPASVFTDEILTEDIPSSPTESVPIDAVQSQLNEMTAKYKELKTRFSSLHSENQGLKEELEMIKLGTKQGSKRQRDTADDEFCAGEVIKAFWRDDDGESWLDATILTVYADGRTCKVKYHVDNGVARLARSWMRKT